jgi:serine/threonine-protein kinase HipA
MATATEAFVWLWLPDATEPVVAGRLDLDAVSGLVSFTYARRYLARDDAVAVYLPDLPLIQGPQLPVAGEVPGAIADAGPDAWGRRVIEHRLGADADRLTLLLESARTGSGTSTSRLPRPTTSTAVARP